MDEYILIEINPVTHLTTDAIGPPGKRVFYLQGKNDEEEVTVIVEKFQVQSLSLGVEQFLAEIRLRMPTLEEAAATYDEEAMHITPPVEPLFRVSEFGLSYDGDNDLVTLIARENPYDPNLVESPTGHEVRFWCRRDQIRAMVSWGQVISGRGRPHCEQCRQPMDPEGHFCARKNGHKE